MRDIKAWLYSSNWWQFCGSTLAPDHLLPSPIVEQSPSINFLHVNFSIQVYFSGRQSVTAHEQNPKCCPVMQPGPLRPSQHTWLYSTSLCLKLVLTLPAAGRHSTLNEFVISHLTLSILIGHKGSPLTPASPGTRPAFQLLPTLHTVLLALAAKASCKIWTFVHSHFYMILDSFCSSLRG